MKLALLNAAVELGRALETGDDADVEAAHAVLLRLAGDVDQIGSGRSSWVAESARIDTTHRTDAPRSPACAYCVDAGGRGGVYLSRDHRPICATCLGAREDAA